MESYSFAEYGTRFNGIPAADKDAETKRRSFSDMEVPDWTNAKGRGPPKRILLPRRLKAWGDILMAIGMTYGELTELEDVAPEIRPTSRSWYERIPSYILVGGDGTKCDIGQVPLVGPQPHKRILRMDMVHRVILVEYAEEFPLAAGIYGMNASLLSFYRSGVKICVPSDFYPVELETDEPSPLTVDPPIGTSIEVIYMEGLGMIPIAKDEAHRHPDMFDYFVTTDGDMIECVGLFLGSQLEPFEMFPEPKDFAPIEKQIRTNPDKLSPGRYCMYRSSKQFMKRTDRAFRLLYHESPIRILEASGIIYRLLVCEAEAREAIGVDKAPPLKKLRVLRFVLRETQLSPWSRSQCFYWLFKKLGNIQSPYPLHATMRVTGCGDLSGRCVLVSYLPRQCLEGDEFGEELDIHVGPKVSAKKKKSEIIQRIIEEERDHQNVLRFKDIRQLTIDDMKLILTAIGFPQQSLNNGMSRWDMAWAIEKVASSSLGMTLFGGSLLPYARREQGAHKSTSRRMKEEEGKVQRYLEEQPQMREFRFKTLSTWQRFKRLVERGPVSSPELKRVKAIIKKEADDMDDDEFAELLKQNLFLNSEERTYSVTLLGDEKSEDTTVIRETKRRHERWCCTVSKKTANEHVQLKAWLVYSFTEDKDLKRLNERVKLQLQRLPVAIPVEEPEENFIVEEEED